MNSNSGNEADEFVQVQNFSIAETFTLEEHNQCEYNPTPQMKVFYAVMFLIIITVGNFLLFCMIIYEKFGMDSPLF